MAIYAISDLHLSFGNNKPMDIFGVNWENHTEKIKTDWLKKVKNDDLVLLPGDFSWAMYLQDTYQDFEYLNNLPGKKLLLCIKSISLNSFCSKYFLIFFNVVHQ